MVVREGFKTPSHGKSPLGGYPPPPPGPQRTRFFCKVSEKNLTEKGGTPPPPLTDPKSKNFSPQAVFFGVFRPKSLYLAQKVYGKKLTERGGTPPPARTISVTRVIEPFPNRSARYQSEGLV